ncbi:MAG: hypothetical protein RIT81_11910 [Deltaproteobacteria bacterium]
MRWFTLLFALLAPATAWAHGADPAVAYITAPTGVGNVVDESVELLWVDADRSIPTGTATVDFYYTDRQPPTFQAGERPDDLVGETIVTGIWEKEMPNAYTWDTTSVPAGSYLIWSQVVEPPEENMAIQIIGLSPGIVTVAHPGDPVHPAVYLTSPTSPFKFAHRSFELTWDAFDPDGTGRVRLEAMIGPDGEPLLIADDLPPDQGSFVWDTSQLEENDWTLKATITDDRGLSFYHYSNYVLLVTHNVPEDDAGVPDAGTPDAGTVRDGGYVKTGEPPDTCACTAGRTGAPWPWVLALFLFRRRR